MGAPQRKIAETQARIGGPRGRAANFGDGGRVMDCDAARATAIGPARGIGSVGSPPRSTAAVATTAQYGQSMQSMA
jgi:hypothetical protein